MVKSQLVIVGGANGVGKTTFAYQYRQTFGIEYLGADDIAREMAGTISGNLELKAGKEFFRRLDRFLSHGRSVIIESTLSRIGLAKQVAECKAKGYAAHIVYVFLDDVELCKRRIELRVKKGGHDVPAEDIERRFRRSLQNFRHVYLPLADTWQLLYNGIQRPLEVAVGEGDKTMIVDEGYYQLFQEIST